MSRWKPEINDIYYFVSTSGTVECILCGYSTFDSKLYNTGNCFQTKEKAEVAAAKVKALLLSLHEEIKEAELLPKLTVEVFDRPDCPKWAKFAVVDKDGTAWWYRKRPVFNFYNNKWYPDLTDCHSCSIEGEYDASNWKDSLIERPVKLPDWCKVREWGYDTTEECYFEIVGITQFNVDVAYIGKDWRYNIGRNVFDDNYKPARLRPYNTEEMKELVGKILTSVKGGVCLCTDYEADTGEVCIYGDWFSNTELLNSVWRINDVYCGVFEHLNEKGEWVN